MLDELHALVTSKRGDLLSLGLARLWQLAPQLRAIGLSATVAEPESLARFLVPQRDGNSEAADIVVAGGAAAPIVEMLDTKERLPWAGHSARHALNEVYDLIKAQQHHAGVRQHPQPGRDAVPGPVADERRRPRHRAAPRLARRRPAPQGRGRDGGGQLRGVVCTSSLDLGVDWGDVDLVINIGAPKGASRLMQRIGRANHRIDEASRAVLVPANRFEVLECRVAIEAVAENAQDTPPLRTGALDVLAQHVLGRACGEPFLSDELYDEVLTAAPYAGLTRADFDDVVDFVATGGYALKTYERFARIRQDKDGRWRVTNPQGAAKLPPQRRHHRRGAHAEGAAGAPRGAKGSTGSTGALGTRRPHARARSRNTLSRGWWSATPLCSAARWCATRRWRKTRSMSRAPATRTPRCRPIWAASFRSRPISPNGSAICSPTSAPGRRCRSRCATGCRCRRIFRAFPARANCWWKPFRAPTSITSSAIRSRGGWRTRRSACS